MTIPAVLGDLGSPTPQSRAYFAHLRSCAACAEYYVSANRAVAFIREHKATFAESLSLVERDAHRQRLIARSWQSIAAKLDNLEAAEKRASRAGFCRLLWKSAAAAACLAIGLSLWLTLSDAKKAPKAPTSPTAFDAKPPIRIELFCESGTQDIAPGEQVATAAGQLKTLLINGRHRLVMNSETTIRFEPLIQEARIGCAVELTTGEIFANVRHDGNPFEAATAHGRTIITGTAFDLAATDTVTTLVVAEGSVRLESDQGAVDVGPGRMSQVARRSAPTEPALCDSAGLTAWASGPETEAALCQIESCDDMDDLADLWLTAVSGPIDLAAINRNEWIEANRDWFAREFPWILELQSALAHEGVKVDYPELLVRSGDIRRFIYSQTLPARIAIPDSRSLLKAASVYGYGEEWLLQNVPSAVSSTDSGPAAESVSVGLKAIEQWANRFKAERNSSEATDPRVVLHSLHLTAYLSNTRILTWLTVKDGRHDFSKADEGAVLDLLREQVETTGNLSRQITSLLWTYKNQICIERCGLIENIIEDIEKIASLEGRIQDCEDRQ